MVPQRTLNFLVADDEIQNIRMITDILSINPITSTIFTADDGDKAYNIYKNNKIDIVITDILMPKLSGIDLIKKLKDYNSNAHIIMMSAYSNIDVVRDAMRNGAYDYILKPFSIEEIMFSVNRAADHLKLSEEKESFQKFQENKIREITAAFHDSFIETLAAITKSQVIRDKSISGHSEKTAEYSVKLAIASELAHSTIKDIHSASLIHDIGKIGIPDSILLKPSGLTDPEYNLIKTHPVIGREIIRPILSQNPIIMNIISSHHERYDGKGYPDGLKGQDIPIEARIAALANAYASMTADTVYKGAKSVQDAISDIESNLGKQFDPDLGRIFIDSVLSRKDS